MEDYSIRITDYLLRQSWQISVLVLVVAAATLALRNRSAHVRYLLWLIVLVKCLMPPLLAVRLPVLPPDKPAGTVAAPPTYVPPSELEMVYEAIFESPTLVRDYAEASVDLLPAAEILTVPVVQREFTIRQWLAITWVIGVTVFFLAAVLKALRTESQLRRRREPLSPKLQTHIANQFASFGVRPFPRIWLVEGLGQPFVWGLVRGSIYLPADFIASGRDAFRRDILSHELSHVLRFDAAVNILQVIAQALFWFHPLVWLANARIRTEREKCCDETAIARLGAEARDYSSAIVEILACEHRQNRPVPSLAVAGSVRNVEERIKTMMTPGKRFYKRPSLVAATAALLLALLTAPTAFVLTARAQGEAAVESEKAPALEPVAERAEREVADRPREERREAERPREAEMQALARHREELQQRARQIERELAGLRDNEDERARDLSAEQREINEQLRNLDRELAERAPQRREGGDRPRREMMLRELTEEHRRLEEEAGRIEDERAALLREGMEQEARQRGNALEEIHERLRQIDEQLARTGRGREPGDRGRPGGPEERRAAMMQERSELAARARELRQQIERLRGGDEPEPRELRDELKRIERRIRDVDRELGDARRGPDRDREARVEELRREIERLAAEGKHDRAAQLEGELQDIMREREGRRDRPAEAPDEDLRVQVRQLREEVTGLRNEMRELRVLIERLLELEPRERPQAERPPQEFRGRR